MKLMVIMHDSHRTNIAVTYENEWLPHGRRVVEVALTPAQVEQLKPHVLGTWDGKSILEQIGETWLEIQ